ncbi:MAG: RNA methyltransferase [Flavobacteriales bacterium]|nr:RNA methyltransferase [Flavobacteriales bacterium]
MEELLRSDLQVRFVLSSGQQLPMVPETLVRQVPQAVMDELGTLETGNSVIAVVDIPRTDQHLTFQGKGLVLALDQVRDPGNLGTILRTADWFGVSQVWCLPGTVDPYNPKVVQSSMGSIFRVSLAEVDLDSGMQSALTQGATVYVAQADGANVFEVELQRPALLVLGNESQGPSERWTEFGASPLGIPGVGRAESLNVSMAATALCMEFHRQSLTIGQGT